MNINLEEIISQLPGHVYWKDKNCVFLGSNTNNWKDFGLKSLQEYIGKTDYDIFPKKEAEQLRKIDKEVMRTGKPKIVEELLTNANGEKCLYLSHKIPLKDKKGQIVGILGQSIDITSAKQTNIDQLDMLENIIAIMPGTVYWMDKEGVYLGCNDNEAKAIGLSSRKEIIGKRNIDLPGFLIPSELDPVNKKIMETGEGMTLEEPAKLADGTMGTFISSKVPIRNSRNEVVGMVGISIDITDRKKIEEALRLAKGKAEASERKAEKAKYIMTEFVSNMGHDFSTPVSEVSAIVEILGSYVDEQPEFKDLFGLLKAGTDGCEKVRKRMIDATSISNLEIKAERFSIIHELLLLKKELMSLIGTKDLKLIIHPLTPKKEDFIITDRQKFHDILKELITNAISFTDQGEINVYVYKENDLLIIQVLDTGTGIPSDKLEYIFEQYTKLSRSQKHGAAFKGLGAGLYLARIRAKLLGATINVESEVGKGSIFTLSTPINYKEID